jgi:cyclase
MLSGSKSINAFLIVISLLPLTGPIAMQGQSERKVTKLAEGVYEIQHKEEFGGSVNGNTTVIIGQRQVFVVDSCFLPSSAREDIAQIREWTDKPVAFVLNTHFHNDHNLGNRIYLDAFPAITIIAHIETKKDMDHFGPGSAARTQQGIDRLQKMLSTGKGPDGQNLSDVDKTEVKEALAKRLPEIEELNQVTFQSATLTFDHDFSIDLGNREVQVKFLGRGNTNGDTVVYLPRERIVMTGDLVVNPIPFFYDGYPTEWIKTLQNLSQLDADTVVPGHGPILHGKSQLYLIRDMMQSAVDQMNAKLTQAGPAMFLTLDSVKEAVDLTPFRQRFAGSDKDLNDAFDSAAADLVKLVFRESSLR